MSAAIYVDYIVAPMKMERSTFVLKIVLTTQAEQMFLILPDIPLESLYKELG